MDYRRRNRDTIQFVLKDNHFDDPEHISFHYPHYSLDSFWIKSFFYLSFWLLRFQNTLCLQFWTFEYFFWSFAYLFFPFEYLFRSATCWYSTLEYFASTSPFLKSFHWPIHLNRPETGLWNLSILLTFLIIYTCITLLLPLRPIPEMWKLRENLRYKHFCLFSFQSSSLELFNWWIPSPGSAFL